MGSKLSRGHIVSISDVSKLPYVGRVQLKCDCPRWHTGGEVKGKPFTLPRNMVYPELLQLMSHTSAASSRLNWRPSRFKWTRPFRLKAKSFFCACAITFQTQSTSHFCSIAKIVAWTRLIVTLHVLCLHCDTFLCACFCKELRSPPHC